MNAMVEELAADRAAPGLLGLAERGLLPCADPCRHPPAVRAAIA